MGTVKQLNEGWFILQDVHDVGEKLELYQKRDSFTAVHAQMSEWEELPELKQLQLLYAAEPYFGRELRYFNQAPWWYKKEFELEEGWERNGSGKVLLKFSNVDYYCRVWVNGTYIGEHEGYSAAFSFEIQDSLQYGRTNCIMVKVSSPWDEEVEGGDEMNRTTLVRRQMVKGTYEHSDTFIQRDVNPVGIYGTVELERIDGPAVTGKPEIRYHFDTAGRTARIAAAVAMDCLEKGEEYRLVLTVKDKENTICCGTSELVFTADEANMAVNGAVDAEGVMPWNTWDHGGAALYTIKAELFAQGHKQDEKSAVTAFRNVELDRTAEKTCFILNGKRVYIRGTSYFPDNYISAMTKERYWRDLLNIRAAGFNLVRVHVHTEQEIFYSLCDELGIAVIQDSEYNWTHPATDEWAERFIAVYKENIAMLMNHPSIICWIGMNEPGCVDPDGTIRTRFMEENPGPRLYREIKEMDPSRPIIKGSFCEMDPYSGDSHNYLGSLSGGLYGDIYGSKEKLNTEYGFDAPPCCDSLKKNSRIFKRMQPLADKIPDIQNYQYKLIKYYTEHYRMQKYQPCSGYVQFMFIDLAPQSFYGLYDWWGIPKKGLQAILESNMPIGVFLKYKEQLDAIYLVNDTDEELRNCLVEWAVTDAGTGEKLYSGKKQVNAEADGITAVEKLDIPGKTGANWNVSIRVISQSGHCIASNHYQDVLHLWEPVSGHPDRMSHEIGMRTYWV